MSSKEETIERFANPQRGDWFSECLAWHMIVDQVRQDGTIRVGEASRGKYPDDFHFREFANADEFRTAYAYSTIPGYRVLYYGTVADKMPHVEGTP